MLTLAFVVEETMAVTKMDLLGYLVNDQTSSPNEVRAALISVTWVGRPTVAADLAGRALISSDFLSSLT
jgi:hypothetical protein